MFGFDDAALNEILMAKALDPSVTLLITLDASQAGGVHEKALIEADKQHDLAAFNAFAVGSSATDQISHTKGFVADLHRFGYPDPFADRVDHRAHDRGA